jgi:2-oxoglutarate ferredoxin oxidoreductase subunit beta
MVLNPKVYESDTRPDWCPGCGDFGVLAALKSALSTLEIPPEKVVISSGIGCSSNLPGYIRAYAHHGLHGRPVPVAVGIKLANPELLVLVTAGDGDEYGIGFNHLVHAARRNHDIKVIVMNNEVYGLTTGQASPTSQLGQKTKSTPDGSYIYPLNPLSALLGAGATFVARGFSGDPKHLAEMIQKAIRHKGFALVDVISPCVTWFDIYDEVRPRIYKLEGTSYDPSDLLSAIAKVNETVRIPIGVFYSNDSRQSFEEIVEREIASEPPVHAVRPLAQPQVEDLVKQFY